MTEQIFRTEELSVVFGGLIALDGLDLAVNRGEIIGLIGPNGAGKTTAFNAITGIVKPINGSVLFKNTNITGRRPAKIARLGIARTFQNIRLYEDLTVLENVMVAGHAEICYSIFEAISGLGRFRNDERIIQQRAITLLELMGLDDVSGEKASNLPYGSQRRLEIARALALKPDLLLLDEPVAGMNPTETKELGELLNTLHSKFDLSILLIEHDMGFVMDICKKIKVIDHGVPIAWGTPKEIQNHEAVISASLGESV
jgi:branched-chain amino acid transport system ATP-binding protein